MIVFGYNCTSFRRWIIENEVTARSVIEDESILL